MGIFSREIRRVLASCCVRLGGDRQFGEWNRPQRGLLWRAAPFKTFSHSFLIDARQRARAEEREEKAPHDTFPQITFGKRRRKG